MNRVCCLFSFKQVPKNRLNISTIFDIYNNTNTTIHSINVQPNSLFKETRTQTNLLYILLHSKTLQSRKLNKLYGAIIRLT